VDQWLKGSWVEIGTVPCESPKEAWNVLAETYDCAVRQARWVGLPASLPLSFVSETSVRDLIWSELATSRLLPLQGFPVLVCCELTVSKKLAHLMLIPSWLSSPVS
jgi:hypothetical protein